MDNPEFPKASTWKRIGLDDNPCRVMALVDNYVVARYKGSAPFIRGVKEFVRVDAPKRKVNSAEPPDPTRAALQETGR